MKIKKIVAIGMATLIGASLLTGCGVSKQQVIDDQANELAVKTAMLNERDVLLAEAGADKAAVDSAYQELQLVLDAKDKELLDYEIKVADLADLELQSEEEIDGLKLGSDIPKQVLNTYELSFLGKGDIEHDGDNYDYEEVVTLDGLKVGVSSSGDLEFEDKPYLLFTKTGAVKYAFEFEDEFEYADVTEDEPLKLKLLGKELTVVKVTADSFTYKVAEEISLKEVESKTIGTDVVILEGVFDGKVRVSVNGEVKSISDGNTKDFGELQVRVKDVLYKGYQSEFAAADLEIGNDILETVEDGDEYVKDDERFVWTMDADATLLKSIGLSYDIKADDKDEEILALGEKLDFLGYFDVGFDLEKSYEYNDYELSFDDIKDEDLAVLKLSTKDKKGIKVGSDRLDKVYFDGEKTYWKEDGEWQESTEDLVLINDETELTVSYDSASKLLSVGDYIKLKTADFKSLQAVDKAEEADVYVYGNPSGLVDETLLLDSGVIVLTPENNAENDMLKISLPDEEVKAVLRVTNK